jgi:N-acetyl-anhydromuramyl-L-alanine amidase AmpD
MAVQIRPTRIEVTDRFPMLGFTIATDSPPRLAEVVVATHPALFTRRDGRTASTFYTSREHGVLTIAGRQAIYTLPADVLARFVASDRLYFGLATASAPRGEDWTVDVMPTASSPYVSLSGLSDRALRRVRMFPGRRPAATYGTAGGGTPTWAGDKVQPGTTPAAPGQAPAAAAPAAAPPAQGHHYDDGFGPLPPLAHEEPHAAPAAASRPSAAAAPAQSNPPAAQGQSWSHGLADDDDAESRGIDAAPYAEEETAATAQANALALTGSGDYARVRRIAPSPAFTTGRAGTTIDRIVIHITDAPTTSSTVNTFTAPGAQASAHYLVGQDGEIVQFVAEADTAWHAKGANKRSIGIEHVAIKQGGADYPRRGGGTQHYDYLPPSETQYCESAALVSHLCQKYALTADRTTIIGHREADPATSHASCPDGAWDWAHFMQLVTSNSCTPQPAQSEGQAATVGQALVFGQEDFDKIRRLHAGDYRDLFQWREPASIRALVERRGFSVQHIEDAVGDLNLDFYKVRIDRFPAGMTAPTLLARFISNINGFVDSGICSFDPYDSSDAALIASADPVGACLKLDINRSAPFYDPRGWDDAAIVISAKGPAGQPTQFYSVTTIHTPDTGDHPVSGHRQFGYYVLDGVTYFYTRGADRATLAFPGTEGAIYSGGESLWRSFQRTLSQFINSQGGAASIVPPFSERFNPSAIRIEFSGWGESSAQALSDDIPLDPGVGGMSIGPDALQIGDIIVSTTTHASSAIIRAFSGAPVSHALLYVGQGGQVIEAVGDGVIMRPLADAIAGSNLAVAFRLPGMDDTKRQQIADAAAQYVGRPYNFGGLLRYAAFKVDSSLCSLLPNGAGQRCRAFVGRIDLGPDVTDRFFCSQLILQAYLDAGRQLTTDAAQGVSPGELADLRLRDGLLAYVGHLKAPIPQRSLFGVSLGMIDAVRRPAAALDAEDWSVNWDDVQLIAQPTNLSCWAAAAAIIDGWARQQSVTPESVAALQGRSPATALPWVDHAAFGQAIGFTVQANACWTPEGFRCLLEANGPLWVSVVTQFPSGPAGHAVVVTGMYRENGSYFVRITDPWDRVVGLPGAPGPRTSSHQTGSRYIMTWEAFAGEYETTGGMADFAQLLHSGGTHGNTINRGSAAAVGYAQGVGDGASGAGGSALTRQVTEKNSRRYDLAQLTGFIRPANALAGGAGAPALPGERVILDDWPYIQGPSGRTQAGVAIDWQYQGGAVGNVAIAPVDGQALDGWSAAVRADIAEDASTPERVMLKVRVTTTFSRHGEEDQVGVSEVSLAGDGRQQTHHGAEPAAQRAAAPAARENA